MYIKNFYNNKNIFVTGATGFIGCVLLETLLYKLEVKHIYCLYRNNILKKYRNNKKITWIKGDILYSNLNIEKNIVDDLYKNINIIFHFAAYTRWDVTLKEQIIYNVDSTINVIEFSKNCINLNILLYTSSYWASCNLDDNIPIEEKIIQDFKGYKEYKNIKNNNSNERLDEWPNSYAYSKNIVERILDEKYKDLPILIARVVSVGPSLKFPYHGFCYDNNSLPSFIKGIKSGAINFPIYLLESINDTIPVDVLVNMLIINIPYNANKNLNIVNCSTSDINPLKLQYIHDIFKLNLFNNYEETEKQIQMMDDKKKSKINKILLKYYDFALRTKYIFISQKTRDIYEKINDYEKNIFSIDVHNINWLLYIRSTLLNQTSTL